LRDINKQMIAGEKRSSEAKRAMTEANLRLVISIAKICEPWLTIPGSDSGR
jgi:RNA polymerase primary sigma factor